MSIRLSAAVPLLAVDRIEPTRAFLCDRLGFRVLTQTVGAGRLELRRDDVALVLCTDARLQADAGDSDIGGPYRGLIRIDVRDVDAFVPEVADADVVLPLRRHPDGAHEIGVREPGGNLLIFTARSPRATDAGDEYP